MGGGAPALLSGKAAQAYQGAHAMGDMVVQLPCYCGCDMIAGHRNLRDCFLDRHGSTWDIRVNEALGAASMVKQGKSIGEIRPHLDRTYGWRG